MKKILFIPVIALGSILANAQIISDDNFNSANFTEGHISETFYPESGQKKWMIFTDAESPVDNFKIETINSRKVASVVAPANKIGGNYLTKTDFITGWKSRTNSNDVLSTEFELFTGSPLPESNSLSLVRVITKDPNEPNNIANLGSFVLDHRDLSLSIIAYSNICNILPDQCQQNPSADIFDWTYQTGEILPANTWVKVGLAYNYNTGEVFMKIINSTDNSTIVDYGFPSALINANPEEIHSLTYSTAVTSSSNTAKTIFGSFKVYATDMVNLLAVNDITKTKVSLSLFPNPTTDFLNIETNSKIESLQVYDMSGKTINSSISDNKVDVRNLPKGTYIIKVKTVNAETTQKFIKK